MKKTLALLLAFLFLATSAIAGTQMGYRYRGHHTRRYDKPKFWSYSNGVKWRYNYTYDSDPHPPTKARHYGWQTMNGEFVDPWTQVRPNYLGKGIGKDPDGRAVKPHGQWK
jgi:hypothetical protein